MITARRPKLPIIAAELLTDKSPPSVLLADQADRFPDSKLSEKKSSASGVLVGVGVMVAVAVWVGVLVAVAVCVGVSVGADVPIAVTVLVGVLVPVAVCVGVGVAVGVAVAVAVWVGVLVVFPVFVGVDVGVLMAVAVGEGPEVEVAVGAGGVKKWVTVTTPEKAGTSLKTLSMPPSTSLNK